MNDRKTINKAAIPWGTNTTGEWKMIRRHDKETNIIYKGKEKTNHPRDGSLSASNPARALDTLSGYHGKDYGKTNMRKTCCDCVD